MKAINDPENFIKDYENEYNAIMNDIDAEYLNRIQYYLNLGYNKRQAKTMAKKFIKEYAKERKNILQTLYPPGAYNKALEVITKNRVIIKNDKKEDKKED